MLRKTRLTSPLLVFPLALSMHACTYYLSQRYRVCNVVTTRDMPFKEVQLCTVASKVIKLLTVAGVLTHLPDVPDVAAFVFLAW